MNATTNPPPADSAPPDTAGQDPTTSPQPPTPPSETPPSAAPPPPPPPKGRSWGRIALIVGGVIVVLLVLASLGRSGDEPTASPSGVAGGSQSEEPATPEPASVPAPTPTPGPAFADISLSGTGDSVPTFDLPEGTAAIAQISHTGSSNFSVISLAADGSDNDLLVNVIGNYSGTVLFDEDTGVHSVAFEVTADGAWTIVIQPVTAARSWDGSSALTGSGDDVVQISPPVEGLVSAAIQHTGESNFAIIGYSSSGADLMVNEIGPYSGEVPIASGTFLLEVSADGSWTITPS